MAVQTIKQIQQDYITNATEVVNKYLTQRTASHDYDPTQPLHPSMPYIPQQKIADLKDLVIASLKGAGLDKEAEHVNQCGNTYSVAKCESCGEYIGHLYNCNERVCPRCYYRNLFRFMNRHEPDWEKTAGFLLVSVDYGQWDSDQMEEGMEYARATHEDLTAHFPFLKGGIYHIELKYNETYNNYIILYHYLLNADVTYAFLFDWALNGRASLVNHIIFHNYHDAQGYFVRHCCQYPADILLDSTKIVFYLSLMKRRRLIQGFRKFYRCSGGLNKVGSKKNPYRCPICGGHLRHVGRTTRGYCFWDKDNSCYLVDPGAPGL